MWDLQTLKKINNNINTNKSFRLTMDKGVMTYMDDTLGLVSSSTADKDFVRDRIGILSVEKIAESKLYKPIHCGYTQ